MDTTMITSLELGKDDQVLEAKVYRKWVSKTIPHMKELDFCCILIDRQNNAIQATMDLKNTTYFNNQLRLKAAYRITGFICEETSAYQQTLPNKISLRFGKMADFHKLTDKESEFPDHYFGFVSYHQLPSRVPYEDEDGKLISPILTDYLGRVRSVSDLTPPADTKTGEKFRRKIDIESFDGNLIDLTLWDKLATQFDMVRYQKMSQPIIIAVSSCRVSKYRGLQLASTPATHYYINPCYKEAIELHDMFKEKFTEQPPLTVVNYRYADPDQEKRRNRQTLYTLLQQHPPSFKDVRFTCEATITNISTKTDTSSGQ